MTFGYIEHHDLNHLHDMGRNGRDPLWRESYYFCMHDPETGYSLITTIGMLPNKGRTAGFVMLMRDGKVKFLRPFVEIGRPHFTDLTAGVRGLSYRVEGIGWNLRFRGHELKFDIQFEPLNQAYPYITTNSDKRFERLGDQHLEQFGTFHGRICFKGHLIEFGPCLGHRDHSWGIRDWIGIDKYRLFSLAFSEDLCTNAWVIWQGGKRTVKGSVFNGVRNVPVRNVRIEGPSHKQVELKIEDRSGVTHLINSSLIGGASFTPPGCVIHETIGSATYGHMNGHGLVEFHERLGKIKWTYQLLQSMGCLA